MGNGFPRGDILLLLVMTRNISPELIHLLMN